MDTRTTLKSGQTFLQILKQLQANQIKASLLYDNNGLTRYEGIIRSITTDAVQPYLLLQDGSKIAISAVIAVNGIFSADYSEC